MKTHIRVIVASTEDKARQIEDLKPYCNKETEVSLAKIETGPTCIESYFDESLCVPGLIKATLEAERDKVDAIVIESMGDTGIKSCREVTSIPIIGLGQTAFSIARNFGSKFSLITVAQKQATMLEEVIENYGFNNSLQSIRNIDLRPLDIKDNQAVEKLLFKAAKDIIEVDNCSTIILAGSYFIGREKNLKQSLLKSGYHPLIIDPLPTAIRYAKFISECGYTQNKMIYNAPPYKEIIGYNLFQNA
ncbi:MAG: aspartate/glutamate racemase family protein [Alphaproteobacteria bacterium]